MKKISYIVILVTFLLLSSCGALMQVTYQPDPPQRFNNPPTTTPDYNIPPPDYNNQPANYNNQPSNYNNNNPAYDNSPQTSQVFYDELSPYGTWINYPDYGYVWVPDVGYDFRPYATNGYWVYSDYGWTWVSNYSWGWAPFHYGRWFYDDYYGWVWAPGNEWAPAWVTWASYGDYYCWAPMAPRIDAMAAANGQWRPGPNSWNVVPGRRFTQPNVNDYIVRTNATVINHVTIINNVTTNSYTTGGRSYGNNNRGATYNRGPQINDVENKTNTRINTIKVNDNNRPGAQLITGNQLLTYKPAIQQNTQQSSFHPVPRKIQPYRTGGDNIKAPQPQQNYNPGNSNQNPNQRPDNPNTVQNPNQRPNNPQQNPQNARPDVNQSPGQNPNQRPTNPQQNPQNIRPDNNPNPGQNQRPNNPQQNPQNMRPDVDQTPEQNPNHRTNNSPQDVRPDPNNPAQNPNPKPNNLPQPTDPRFRKRMPQTKPDTSKKQQLKPAVVIPDKQ